MTLLCKSNNGTSASECVNGDTSKLFEINVGVSGSLLSPCLFNPL